jgi:hypothetical protein
MAQWNKNTGDFLDQQRSLFEVIGVATSDGNIVSADNPFPVSIGGESVTITGEVTVPGTIEISNDHGNPIPTHAHIFDENDNEYGVSNPFPVIVGAGTTVDANVLNEVAVSGVGSIVNIQGTVGIGTTGQVSININTIPVGEYNRFPVSLPSVATDAFGRQRMSNSFTLFDSSHRYKDNGLWSSLVVGTGSTVGFVTTQGLVNLTVGVGSTASIIRETTRVFAYQPGKSLQVLSTFVMNAPKTNLRQRVGYFGADNGMYLELDGNTLYFVERSLVTGTVTQTRVAQSDWNIDKLDGTGPSGITLDITKAQILWMDIEWLGLGTVRMGFVIDGVFIHCHSFHHANFINTTYITTASLPLRYEIANTGITTSASTLKQVCSSVISEGGYELRGTQQAVNTPITSPYNLATAGTYYPVVSIRLKSNKLDAIVIPTAISILGLGDSTYNWQIRASSGITGGTWVSAGDDSAVEYNLTATGLTDGRILASGFFDSSKNNVGSIDILREALFKFQLERDGLTGTPSVISIVATCANNNKTVLASMDWEEVSR